MKKLVPKLYPALVLFSILLSFVSSQLSMNVVDNLMISTKSTILYKAPAVDLEIPPPPAEKVFPEIQGDYCEKYYVPAN